MNVKTLKSVLLVMATFVVRAYAVHRSAPQPIQESRIERPSSCERGAEEKVPYIYYLGSNGSVQMFRSGQQRSGSFSSFPFAYFNKYKKSYLKSFNLTYLQQGVGYVRSCRLILFPFHVFW